jgi:hypothetical protein
MEAMSIYIRGERAKALTERETKVLIRREASGRRRRTIFQ